ncbi:hypothetical protein RHGRI_036940 [Rhododendron griersonianum]|uniref:Uncharacterized protein n=1 Tax=Rhododendron griersonianum TaxID=479676 RepID=A0AAV6HTP4_9ERIC|nr:hypothetical protein RHGRI_036940 [Rhododendron griersonianum]
MGVDLNLLRSQLFSNRNEGNGGIYNTQMGSGVGSAGAMPETLLPFPQSLISDSVPMKITAMKSDNSGVTYYVHANPRKRYRDSVNDQILNTSNLPNKANNNNNNLSDIPLLIHQHQLEIQYIVSQHKQQARLLVSKIGEGVAKKLKEKDEQIQRMGKLNWVLQERVKSLFAENQLWRDLAQSNEATANSLRSNLKQVLLAHVSNDCPTPADDVVGCDDAESCCDNGDYEEEGDHERHTLAVGGGDGERVKKDKEVVGGGGKNGKRMCKRCRSFNKAMDSSSSTSTNAPMPRYRIRVCGCNLQAIIRVTTKQRLKGQSRGDHSIKMQDPGFKMKDLGMKMQEVGLTMQWQIGCKCLKGS